VPSDHLLERVGGCTNGFDLFNQGGYGAGVGGGLQLVRGDLRQQRVNLRDQCLGLLLLGINGGCTQDCHLGDALRLVTQLVHFAKQVAQGSGSLGQVANRVRSEQRDQLREMGREMSEGGIHGLEVAAQIYVGNRGSVPVGDLNGEVAVRVLEGHPFSPVAAHSVRQACGLSCEGLGGLSDLGSLAGHCRGLR
jgi:hypothetical protein